MKSLVTLILLLFIPHAAYAGDQEAPTISNTCQIRSQPGASDGSTVEYAWKITVKTTEDRILSVEQLTRSERPSSLPDLRGYQKFLYCKAGSPHEKEIRLEVDQATDGGERTYWLEGFLTSLINQDFPLSKSATVSVSTRQANHEDKPGHLIDIMISDQNREVSRHWFFISFWSPEDLQNTQLWSDLSEGERVLRDGNAWQYSTDPRSWERTIRRFADLDK